MKTKTGGVRLRLRRRRARFQFGGEIVHDRRRCRGRCATRDVVRDGRDDLLDELRVRRAGRGAVRAR